MRLRFASQWLYIVAVGVTLVGALFAFVLPELID